MNDIARDDFERLETKVDKMADSLSKLILIEERQSSQGERIGKVESRVSACEALVTSLDKKMDQWVNRGVGVWALAAILFAIYKSLHGAG